MSYEEMLFVLCLFICVVVVFGGLTIISGRKTAEYERQTKEICRLLATKKPEDALKAMAIGLYGHP